MSERQRIVSNTGPLISLEKLHRGYDFIRRIYEQLVVLATGLAEVAEGQFENPQAYV